jgi:hypothetical protein
MCYDSMKRAPSRNTNKDAPKRQGGRVRGAKNDQMVLFDLVFKYRPINSTMWDVVAQQYRISTGELDIRPDLKKYFIHKM